VWQVDAKRLDSKDQRFTQSCKICLDTGSSDVDEGEAAPMTEFIVWMQAEVQKKRRNCANFSASKGKGHIYVKCNEEKDVDLALSIEVGGNGLPAPGMPIFWVKHNFAENSVVQLPTIWDFKAMVNEDTGKLTLGFEAKQLEPEEKAPGCSTQKGLPLSPLPSHETAENVPGSTARRWWGTTTTPPEDEDQGGEGSSGYYVWDDGGSGNWMWFWIPLAAPQPFEGATTPACGIGGEGVCWASGGSPPTAETQAATGGASWDGEQTREQVWQ
jgi:hypothetical protein